MGKSSTTKASAVFNFRADLDVKCYDDQVEIEVDQTKLIIEQLEDDAYATFVAIVNMIDLENPNNRAIIRFDVQRFRLINLEKNYKCTASSDSVLVEKITSEDEEVRRKFYDIIDDWTEFELHVYAAD